MSCLSVLLVLYFTNHKSTNMFLMKYLLCEVVYAFVTRFSYLELFMLLVLRKLKNFLGTIINKIQIIHKKIDSELNNFISVISS